MCIYLSHLEQHKKNMLMIFSVAHIMASIPLTAEMNTLIQYHWEDWIE